MTELQRLTTDYVETEDRVRLRGALASGESVVIWLTRRLMDRLVRHLIGVLAQHGEELPAGPALPADAPVSQEPPVSAEHAEIQWVAQAVDVSVNPGAMQLSFRDAERLSRITLDGRLLRQWLDGLRDLYILAEWPLTPWEGWGEQKHSARQAPRFVH